MARPNVTFRLNDQTIVSTVSETPSDKLIAAMLSDDTHIGALATFTERAAGMMFIQNSDDLYARLTKMVNEFSGGATYMAGVTLYSTGECAAGYINNTYRGTGFSGGGIYNHVFGSGTGTGFTGGRTAFSQQFWAINNYLQYGAPCYVGIGGSGLCAGISGFQAISDNAIFDVIFQGISSAEAVANVIKADQNISVRILNDDFVYLISPDKNQKAGYFMVIAQGAKLTVYKKIIKNSKNIIFKELDSLKKTIKKDSVTTSRPIEIYEENGKRYVVKIVIEETNATMILY